ncbi:hypothetical protein AE32_01884 [Acinetobacter nosocomialis]|jgi:hypothetical protein|uniref:Uncharacterized protein n=4 Tax=Moraxellaceae TaxID=468 RepID=A0AA36KAX6_ACINO|nr:hypothetical protein HMPREF0014_01622 [Acinetobacter sp. RUH 2624]EKF45291.1 hypothetical protein W9I_01952 [Acinetobacter nosocomialis Ab22222]EKU62170.1 hypothetical protein ACINWC487_2012 [Acinetobacter nosocomialis]ENV39548.1 hypothetical protein F958_02575 [Acinetobacter nosocomialis NIPH 386]CDG75344.1 hypothetical protein ANICBIBUN_12295 [Acinetobacter nosocomialis 28F]
MLKDLLHIASMKKNTKLDQDKLFIKLLFKSSSEVTEDEVEYYRKYPDQIDQVTAPINIHKVFLWTGAFLGIVVVAIAKFFKFSGTLDFLSEGVLEFVIDIIYETGIALIGAAVTAYVLGVLLNKQQENATKWREEIRRKINESEEL